MNKTNKTALITGASSGLGMELARLHAAIATPCGSIVTSASAYAAVSDMSF